MIAQRERAAHPTLARLQDTDALTGGGPDGKSFHVLGHLPAVARVLGIGGREETHWVGRTPGSAGRWLALSGAMVGGLVLAVVLIPEFAAWTAHGVFLHHHDH
jgi:hypothetical protein